jgi:uncharacterized membrane protein YsdA (DUF1294 family)
MVITFSCILIGLLALIRPLQKNNFYILHTGIVILAAYYIETHWFRASVFGYKTLLLFLVFHIISINLTTIVAYFVDKRAATRHAWRVPENTLHVLEFLGGWLGALIAQKIFHHKTKKKSFRNIFWLMVILEFFAVWIILKYLKLI